jgi:hypothetical protein
MLTAVMSMALMVSGLVMVSAPAEAEAEPQLHVGLGRALVVGSNDNGAEGNNVASTLEDVGLDVDRLRGNLQDGWEGDHEDRLVQLLEYQSIWYVEAYEGLDDDEVDLLVEYSNAGGNLYLTGERPCCEALNSSVNALLDRVLTDDVTVGGQGDINGPFAFNGGALGGVTTAPNLLVDFVPQSPGGMQIASLRGVSGRNAFATSESVVVGGVWDETDMTSGKGRLALLMDIDWLNFDSRKDIIENVANFLSANGLCSDVPDSGLAWTGGPGNCGVITAGTYTWSASVEQGSGPFFAETASDGVSASCTYTLKPPRATYTCAVTVSPAIDITSKQTLRIRATAGEPGRQLVRTYRVRSKNDVRNVPTGYAIDSGWWEWPDQDDDGLPDKWERDGVWVRGKFLDLPSLGSEVDHKDLFLRYDYQEGHRPSDDTIGYLTQTFADSPLTNPSGRPGVTLHVEVGTSVPEAVVGSSYYDLSAGAIQRVGTYTGFFSSAGYGGGGVPSIYKSLINLPQPEGTTIGTALVKGQFGWTGWDINYFFGTLPVTLQGWDSLNRGKAISFAQASNAAHELGHQLGLRHHNDTAEPTKDPSYKSVMSYSYNQFGFRRNGVSVIDYSRSATPKLDWKMGSAIGSLSFVYGQSGELANSFYDHQPDQEIPLQGEDPAHPSEQPLIPDQDSLTGFFEEFDAPQLPRFPVLTSRTVHAPAGGAIDIVLDGKDPYGREITYVVDNAPRLGSVAVTPSGLRYQATQGKVGSETLLVRAVAGPLGSRQAAISVVIDAVPATPLKTFPSTAKVGKPSGRARIGSTLRARPSGFPAGTTFTYRWFVNGKSVSTASRSTFKVPARVRHRSGSRTTSFSVKRKRVSVVVTASRQDYLTRTVRSPSTGRVAGRAGRR